MKKSVWSRMADNHAKEVELCVRYREALLRVGDTRVAKDWTAEEVERAAMLAGAEGFAVMNMDTNNVYVFKWFVEC